MNNIGKLKNSIDYDKTKNKPSIKQVFNSIQPYIERFLLFCIMGWLYEVLWCNLFDLNLGWENNGFLFGPWLPIYGFGMSLILLFFKYKKVETPGKIFLYGALIATIAELMGSYFMQIINGSWLWDYTKYFANFQGRIAVKPSIMFGLLILLCIYIILPRFTNLQNKYKNNIIRNIISISIMILFVVDLLLRFKFGSNV